MKRGSLLGANCAY